MKKDKDILNSLHRTQGQLEGVERMLEKKRDCSDVVMQLMAARSSLERIAVKLLEGETRICLKSQKKEDQRRIKELAITLFKYT